MRGLLLAALIAFAAPASAECLPGCDGVLTDEAAVPALRREIGIDLPPGGGVTGLVRGGVRDGSVQARIVTDAEGAKAILTDLGLSPEGLLGGDAISGTYWPPGPDWWDPQHATQASLVVRPDDHYVSVGLAEIDGATVVWLWAYQT